MQFEQLIKLVSSKKLGIKTDSRKVRNGDVFVAIKGTNTDGHKFIGQAVGNGAEYAVISEDCDTGKCEKVIVNEPAPAAGLLAQAAKGYPANKLTNLAVTGTNGKTTVAFAVRHILKNAGKKCGLITTIQYDNGREIKDSNLTTPNPLKIAEITDEMVKSGCEFMITEASSHALSQQRLAGIPFKAAAFTNLTGDHLDYHKNEQQYLEAKSILFRDLPEDAAAVLNRQAPESEYLKKIVHCPVLWYSLDGEDDISAEIKTISAEKTVFEISFSGEKYNVTSNLIGRYNAANLLAAAGLAMSAGIGIEEIVKALNQPLTVPGRLEKVPCDKGFTVIVDYAHTDDALKNVLNCLNEVGKGRIITVFGCGGDRDSSKRARMAKVSEELSDITIVTSDNPRTEEPEYIIGEIATGFANPASEEIIIELERKEAIETALNLARKDDIVLIAGKGHERYQTIGDRKIPFSDVEIAKEFIQRL
jgi:UDP-N-acetylmuramoyl-L-alanyl-D-glutamate--2,6-diaminopimelate ligase